MRNYRWTSPNIHDVVSFVILWRGSLPYEAQTGYHPLSSLVCILSQRSDAQSFTYVTLGAFLVLTFIQFYRIVRATERIGYWPSSSNTSASAPNSFVGTNSSNAQRGPSTTCSRSQSTVMILNLWASRRWAPIAFMFTQDGFVYFFVWVAPIQYVKLALNCVIIVIYVSGIDLVSYANWHDFLDQSCSIHKFIHRGISAL